MALFTETSSLKEAVHVINGISTGKLSLILQRVASSIKNADAATFTDDEKSKLCSTLKIDQGQLTLMLDTCNFILLQAAYHCAKPVVLGQQLVGVGMEDQRSSVFESVWGEEAKSVVEFLRKKSLAPNQLETINWQLSLQLAHSFKTKQKTPCATFELGIKNSSTQATDRVQIELDHQELYQFFNQLDTIQSQLDTLT